jgi:hypothetical protein
VEGPDRGGGGVGRGADQVTAYRPRTAEGGGRCGGRGGAPHDDGQIVAGVSVGMRRLAKGGARDNSGC